MSAGLQLKKIEELGMQTEEARVREVIDHSMAKNTKRAYASDWADFEAYCNDHGLTPLPARERTVALYLVELADKGMKAATIDRRVCAISLIHKAANYDPPTRSTYIRKVIAGIRRMIGTSQQPKTPLLTEQLKRLLSHVGKDIIGVRDKAILLLGFAGAFRRSELVSLAVSDLTLTPEGIIVYLRESKTDQEKQGIKKGIPYGEHVETCPVLAVQNWIKASGVSGGDPLFHGFYRDGRKREGALHPEMVAVIVKKYADKAGLDCKHFAGHSLRSGMATSAAANGADERSIMQQTGHTSSDMVRRYIRDGRLFRDNAAKKLGL